MAGFIAPGQIIASVRYGAGLPRIAATVRALRSHSIALPCAPIHRGLSGSSCSASRASRTVADAVSAMASRAAKAAVRSAADSSRGLATFGRFHARPQLPLHAVEPFAGLLRVIQKTLYGPHSGAGQLVAFNLALADPLLKHKQDARCLG